MSLEVLCRQAEAEASSTDKLAKGMCDKSIHSNTKIDFLCH